MSKPVFIPSVIVITAALVFAIWYSRENGEEAGTAFEALRDDIGEYIGWWYVLLVTSFVIFALWAGLSKAGNIRLGRDDEKPEFSMGSWFAMLFSAGMGIGLVFWGVAEPLNHMLAQPEIGGLEDGSAAAAREAVGQTMYHWGLHAWAIYVVVGLGLAYMTFRRGRPLSIRWLLEPVFGRKLIESWVGHAIDVVAIVGTVFGVATSLGTGVIQVQAGLGYLDWFDPSNTLLVALVGGITALTAISVVIGIHKGMKILSNANMIAAAVLALVVLAFGPTVFLLQSFVGNSGSYLTVLPEFMLNAGAGTEDGWTLGWTIYYWGWWMSWAPFVGMFIARISRGRTVREFVFGVLLAPTIIGMLWFTIFGSSGIWYQLQDEVMTDADGVVDTDTSLFLMLEQLPLGAVAGALAVLAMIIVVLFFVTSSDSGSLVVDVLAQGGATETPRITRLFWALLMGAAALILLIAGGEAALTVLQVSSISAAAPLSLVYVLAMIALIRILRYESINMPRYVRVRQEATKSALVSAAQEAASSDREEEVEKSLREILANRARSARTDGLRGAGSGLGSASATLAGLSSDRRQSSQEPQYYDSEDVILAVHDVPAYATVVDPHTGTLDWEEEASLQDPVAEEVFDTPEFAESAVGWEQETEQFFEETVATGTLPTVEDTQEDAEK
ncbi:BCCT family transporter [Nesterenkonia cremea]|uniref:Transporter n=1 Tax=Nesterenkonia cremea TaxID=1882340 RepID=A0A917AL22_9MICC|nr:BCCT family transporter [Nesterenkonia cremea]GGE59950.1 putative transporter [Nesterenkonia cremea]